MWFSAIKLAVQAGSHIFKNRQKTKMLMADAQMLHAEKMAKGQAEYQGKLLEARQSDWKDEFILVLLSAPIALLSWAVFSDDPAAMEKMKLFFEYFSQLPFWYQTIFVGVIASVYGLKATDLIKGNNMKKVDKKKNPGLAKLPTEVRNKMGYMAKGGKVSKSKMKKKKK
jgi:hypothetical protein